MTSIFLIETVTPEELERNSVYSMEMSNTKKPEKVVPIGVSENISQRLQEFHDAFAKEAERMSGNLFGITREVGQEDEYLATLADSLQLIHNYLLNLISRPDLLMGYVKRIYLNKEAIDRRDETIITEGGEYMYGDTPIAQPYAPLFKHLWLKHLTDGGEGEKTKIWRFFSTYNNIVEDWILEGAIQIFDDKTRKFDCRVLRKIKASLMNMEDVPEEDLEDSKEMEDHYKLLKTLREEFVEYRRSLPLPASTPKTGIVAKKKVREQREPRESREAEVTEASSLTVTKHSGSTFDVEA